MRETHFTRCLETISISQLMKICASVLLGGNYNRYLEDSEMLWRKRESKLGYLLKKQRLE
jgi:hypothetical protein